MYKSAYMWGLNRLYLDVLFPSTPAEKTVHWFLYGVRYYLPPKHANCRCTYKVLSKEDAL